MNDELAELRERLRTQRPVAWEQLPDIPLYMDQVLSYMERQVLRFDEGDSLTAAMINNYTKSGLVPRADGKKYNQEHLAYLTAICVLKRVMSTKDMDLTIRDELAERGSIRDSYQEFCKSLDASLNLTAEIMEAYNAEDEAADGAIHFALLSYAAGLASSRYVELLRSRQAKAQAEEKAAKKLGKREKPAKEADNA
jgi:hypothetical protein